MNAQAIDFQRKQVEIPARSGSSSAIWTQNTIEGNSVVSPYSCDSILYLSPSQDVLGDYAWYCGNNYDIIGTKGNYVSLSKHVGFVRYAWQCLGMGTGLLRYIS